MSDFFKGTRYSIPIVLGYLPIAVSFGAVAKISAFDPAASILMSATVFAGASQFIAMGMFSKGVGILQIILATFVVNLRHIVMSFSVLPLTRQLTVPKKLLLFLGITDETFAVVSLSRDPGVRSAWGMAGLILPSYFSWVAGTALGIYLASFMPEEVRASMSVAIYALFIALLLDALLDDRKYFFVVAMSIAMNMTLVHFMSSGWSLIIATVVSPLIFVLVREGGKDE